MRLVHGIIAGLSAAAATGGALLLFGWKLGDPFQAFAHIGRQAVGPGAPALSAAVGIVVHAAVLVLWGALFGLLAPRRHGLLPVIMAAVAMTIAALLVHFYLLPSALLLGAGLGGPRAPHGPVVALHLLFALALTGGLLAARRS